MEHEISDKKQAYLTVEVKGTERTLPGSALIQAAASGFTLRAKPLLTVVVVVVVTVVVVVVAVVAGKQNVQC